MKPIGTDERTGNLRKRHKGTGRNDPNTDLGDCENIQTGTYMHNYTMFYVIKSTLRSRILIATGI